MMHEELRARSTKKLPENTPAAERLKLLDGGAWECLAGHAGRGPRAPLVVGGWGWSLGIFLGLNTGGNKGSSS